MAIQWGSWEYAGGNGMRVGVDVDHTSISNSSSSCTVTFSIYTENQYRYNNPNMHLGLTGTSNYSDADFYNNDTGGAIKRATRTYKYDFDSNDWGSGTAKTVTLTASISNTYNGVTPSKTVSYSIPKRPYATPAAPSGVTTTRTSDSSTTVSWTRNSTSGKPYDTQRVSRWDNVSNEWTIAADNISGSATSLAIATTGNRQYRFRVYAHNDAGWSDSAYSGFMQTTPASPFGCSINKTSPTSIVVNWSNGASTLNGYSYDTILEEQVDGGVWNAIATLPAGTASYSRTGINPGSVYAYRVRARSTTGDTTYSDYTYSGSVQLQSPPAAPTGLGVVRTNDNSFTLSWTNHPNGELAPYTGLTVQRWDNVSGAWLTVGNLGPTATNLTDLGTVADRAYQWRIAATNAAGSSAWAYFANYQTRPAPPVEVKAKAAPGGSLLVSWVNKTSYPQYTIVLRYFKDGTLVNDTIGLAAGTTSYLLTGVDLTASYTVGVKSISGVGYASESPWADSDPVAAATVPNAPVNLMPNGVTVDLNFAQTLTWKHNSSIDGSDQSAFELEYSTNGGTTWVATGGKKASVDSSWTLPAGTLPNGPGVTWHVRTWGVHADPSPWSVPAAFTTSTTPTVTINEPEGGTLPISRLDVSWSYHDAESTPQASWEVELYDGNGSLLEAQRGDGTTSAITMATVIVDGASYNLRLRVKDGDGLESVWVSRSLVASFTPPAMPELSADYSQDTGVTVLTLTPTPDDGGVTSLPVIGVDLQRRLLDAATGTFGPWETLAANISADATLIDTTSPIANDGEYRVIAYSEAPSSEVSDPLPPAGSDDRWVYLSGGPNFQHACRLMGNVSLRSTTSRDRTLYQFAGRDKPVMFAGEATSRVTDVAGLLDAESSSPAEWEELISSSEVVLFRDPLGRRIYGSVPQVAIDYLGNDMYAISFTVTEVSFP